MSIKQIEKEFKVGYTKARQIKFNCSGNIFLGRPPLEISQEEVDFIKNYREEANVGFQRMCSITQRDENAPHKMSEWKCRKIYEHEDLFVYSCDYQIQENKHPKRFVARYAGQAWHTDLHYLKKIPEDDKQLYLMSFIDDRTRKIIYYEIIPEKSAKYTNKVLLNALENNQKFFHHPKTIIIDNGKEFTSQQFQKTLNNFSINDHRIHAYTPEENGKIERFWETLERSATHPLRGEYLDWIIDQYNRCWAHKGLKELTGEKITPNEAWEVMEHYTGQEDADFIYTEEEEDQE